MRCCSALGHGLLWFLFDSGSLCFLFTKGPVPIERWNEWAKQAVVARTRKIGEKHEATTIDGIVTSIDP